MPARAAARSLLGNDSEMQSYGFTADRIFAPDSVDSNPRHLRWAVLVWDEETPPFASKPSETMELWLYQPREMGHDYAVLDIALARARELLTTVEHLPGEDGWILTAATYRTGSRDLVDDVSHAITKYGRFHVACRTLVTP